MLKAFIDLPSLLLKIFHLPGPTHLEMEIEELDALAAHIDHMNL
jgi:hypothetical protein